MRKSEVRKAPAVSVSDIDAEHEKLFELCEQLRSAVARRAPSGEVEPILHDLIAHTANHFAHEERDMRSARYTHYAWHRRQHRAARSQIARLHGRPIELLEFLAAWLPDHIGIADRMLGAYLRNRQRAAAAG